jgi:mannosyltransferase
MSAVRRPFGAMLGVLSHIDGVHSFYYLLMHAVAKLGTSELTMRLPSVLGIALASLFTSLIGSRLAGNRAGLAAGLLFGLSPIAVEYAQDARPFALVTALAALATFRFVVFIESGSRRDAMWYGIALALCGLADVFGLLIIAAHLVTLATTPAMRPHLARFVIAALAAALVISPLVCLAATQVSQVGWEHRPGPVVLTGVISLLAAVGVLYWIAIGRKSPRSARARAGDAPGEADSNADGSALLAQVSAPWFAIPVAILLAVSQIPIAAHSDHSAATSGIWEPRYLLFAVPGLALLLAAAVSRLRPRAAALVMSVAIVAVAGAQPLARPAHSQDDLRAVSSLLAERARHGDAVLFPDIAKRLIEDAYPSGFLELQDIGLDRAPSARSSLYGLNVRESQIMKRLRRRSIQRIWLVTFPLRKTPSFYGNTTQRFCLVSIWRFPLNEVSLYRKC